jgi:ABC-type nitrate/sulfonate/bicarbonate transport system substrate-binding protein
MKKHALAISTIAAVLSATLAGCGDSSDATSDAGSSDSTAGPTETLSLGVQSAYGSFIMEMAEDQGFLEEAGYASVEPRVFNQLPALLTAGDKGQVDLIVSGLPPVVRYNEAGGKLRGFAPSSNASPLFYATKDSGLSESGDDWKAAVEEWKGKTIGVIATGGVLELAAREVIREAGLNPDTDVKFVAIGAGPAAATAVKQDLVEVVVTIAETGALLTNEDLAYPILLPHEGEGPEDVEGSASALYFTGDDLITADPEKYQKLNEAITKSVEFIRDDENKEDVLAVLEKIGFEPDIAEVIYELDMGSDGTFNTESLSEETVTGQLETLQSWGLLAEGQGAYESLVRVP